MKAGRGWRRREGEEKEGEQSIEVDMKMLVVARSGKKVGAHKYYWTKGVKAQKKNKTLGRNKFSGVTKSRAKRRKWM